MVFYFFVTKTLTIGSMFVNIFNIFSMYKRSQGFSKGCNKIILKAIIPVRSATQGKF
jgi:hypothetical protein